MNAHDDNSLGLVKCLRFNTHVQNSWKSWVFMSIQNAAFYHLDPFWPIKNEYFVIKGTVYILLWTSNRKRIRDRESSIWFLWKPHWNNMNKGIRFKKINYHLNEKIRNLTPTDLLVISWFFVNHKFWKDSSRLNCKRDCAIDTTYLNFIEIPCI